MNQLERFIFIISIGVFVAVLISAYLAVWVTSAGAECVIARGPMVVGDCTAQDLLNPQELKFFSSGKHDPSAGDIEKSGCGYVYYHEDGSHTYRQCPPLTPEERTHLLSRTVTPDCDTKTGGCCYRIAGCCYHEDGTTTQEGCPIAKKEEKRHSAVRRQFLARLGLTHTPKGCQVDHFKPLFCGGADSLDNLRLICGDYMVRKERIEQQCEALPAWIKQNPCERNMCFRPMS